MSKVLGALSVSVDGYITGRNPGAGRGLGDATMLFDWYFDGETPSEVSDGFCLSEASAAVFDAAAARVGASLVGRHTYDDSGWAAGGTPRPHAPRVVLSHRPAPDNVPDHVELTLLEAVPAPGVTHLKYEVLR